MTRRTRTFRPHGFTLIEAMMASLMLTMVVSAAVVPFTAGMQNAQYSGRKTEAVALAEDLMEEILAKPFYDPDEPGRMTPGPDTMEFNRTRFDNVDDYHGYVEPAGEIVPSQAAGVAADVDPNLSRSASVEYVHLAGQDAGRTANVCRVIVTVGDQTGDLARLSRLVYGDAEEE